MVENRAEISYPLIIHVQEKAKLPTDPLVKNKYLRLRRILLEFRSHSRGSLAKLKDKIEADRVLRNDLGRRILERLLKDRILTLKERHYHLDTDRVNYNIGISYQDLRKGLIPESLIRYLHSIS